MMVTPRFLSGSSTRCDVRFGVGPIGTLPLYAPFDSGNDMGWSTYGGSWSVSGGVYGQSGASSGPKSLVGSTGWTDVAVTTDLRLDSAGQAGVLLRTDQSGSGSRQPQRLLRRHRDEQHPVHRQASLQLDGTRLATRDGRHWRLVPPAGHRDRLHDHGGAET